jgi:hypothetical protein
MANCGHSELLALLDEHGAELHALLTQLTGRGNDWVTPLECGLVKINPAYELRNCNGGS